MSNHCFEIDLTGRHNSQCCRVCVCVAEHANKIELLQLHFPAFHLILAHANQYDSSSFLYAFNCHVERGCGTAALER